MPNGAAELVSVAALLAVLAWAVTRPGGWPEPTRTCSFWPGTGTGPAVLEALAKKAGPEDTRTAAQRRHDALGEACRRLIASGMLPARAGRPTQAQVHITLAELRGLWVRPSRPSRRTCAARSPAATRTVLSPAATRPPACATCTI